MKVLYSFTITQVSHGVVEIEVPEDYDLCMVGCSTPAERDAIRLESATADIQANLHELVDESHNSGSDALYRVTVDARVASSRAVATHEPL